MPRTPNGIGTQRRGEVRLLGVQPLAQQPTTQHRRRPSPQQITTNNTETTNSTATTARVLRRYRVVRLRRIRPDRRRSRRRREQPEGHEKKQTPPSIGPSKKPPPGRDKSRKAYRSQGYLKHQTVSRKGVLYIAYLVSGRGPEYRSRYRFSIEAGVREVHPWLVHQ